MQTTWKEFDLDIEGSQFHYTCTGCGSKPPLVLVHGFSDNGLCWTPVAEILEKNFDIYMPDMRGHGLSARVVPGQNIDMALDLAHLIRAWGLEKPIVIGHSMGALFAYQLAVRFPDLVKQLVLEDPAWFMPATDTDTEPKPPQHSPDNNPMTQWVRSLAKQSFEEIRAGYIKDHPDWPQALIEALAHGKKQLDQGLLEVLFPRMGGDSWPWYTTLQDVKIPVYLFCGNKELGGIVGAEMQSIASSLKPDLEVRIFSQVGHLIRFEAFPAFMTALNEALA